MNKKVIITLTIVGLLGSAILVGVTAVFYLSQNNSRQEIKRLKTENKEIKENIKELEDEKPKEDGKSAEESKKSTDNSSSKDSTSSKKSTTSKSSTDSEKEAIKKLVISAGQTELGHSIVSNVEDIRYKDNWATAWTVPTYDSDEGYLSVLQKKDGQWTIIDAGTGFEHSDYPDSPKEIWP
ncbi:MAG: hypothetical protein E3J54_04380 [Actinobacteria bacterium]|nr:MAG: hypothetical protein E3J54_04380 [Actinomycetota bacterium]